MGDPPPSGVAGTAGGGGGGGGGGAASAATGHRSSDQRRRSSVAAQIGRTARRFSAAIVPQLAKLEPITVLQHVERLDVELVDVKEVENAMNHYLLHNSVFFDPIHIAILDVRRRSLLQAVLAPDEIVLLDGQKQLLNITFADPAQEGKFSIVAKIRHPVSGMKLFDILEFDDGIHVVSAADESDRLELSLDTSSWRALLTRCGCLFTRNVWRSSAHSPGSISLEPVLAFFEENSFRLCWSSDAPWERRVQALAVALLLVVREAFPSLQHVVAEFRARKAAV